MSSRLLARIPVIPFYNQVVIGDYKESGVPEWDAASSRAGVTASDTSLLIATCNDQDGYVVVDIRDGEPAVDSGPVIFDGTLRIDSQTLTVGAVTVDPSRVMFLPRAGEWNVRVSVDPPGRARHITVVINGLDDPDVPDATWMAL